MDVEHATNDEFTAWLHWNGIPFTGIQEWTFDSKCAVINHVLSNGLKPRLIGPLENCSGIVSQVFEVIDISPKRSIRVRLNCGCVVDVSGGWLGASPLTSLTAQCPNDHKWQNVKEEVTAGS